MTWVYCEPKSRMRILEWAGGAAVFTARVRGSGSGGLIVRIVGTIHRAERAVAGDAALEFFPGLLHHRFFQRIGAAGDQDRARDAKGSGEGFQALKNNRKVTGAMQEKWRNDESRKSRMTNSCYSSDLEVRHSYASQ